MCASARMYRCDSGIVDDIACPLVIEGSALPRTLGHGDELRQTVAHQEPLLAASHLSQCAHGDVIRGEQQPEAERGARHEQRAGQRAEGRRGCAKVQRDHRQRRDGHQNRGAPLQPEHRQQDESCGEAAAHGARRVGEVQDAGTPADGALGVLDDRVGQRKAETHEERGNRHLRQHRPGIEPELGERADGWHPGIQRIDRTAEAADGIVVDGVHIGPPQADERRGHEEPLSRHQPFGRTAGAAEHGSADQRADADAEKNQCKQQREDGPEAAEQDVEVAEPQNFHAERGQADHRERDAGQPDGAAAVGDIAIGARPASRRPDGHHSCSIRMRAGREVRR